MVTTRSQVDKAEIEAAYAAATLDTARTRRANNCNNNNKNTTSTGDVDDLAATLSSLNVGTVASPERQGEQEEQAIEQEIEEVFEPVTTIPDFWHVISTTPAEQWKKRTAALDSLVGVMMMLSDGNSEFHDKQPQEVLATSISQLLLDPRSSVVKLTCGSLKQLFQSHGYMYCPLLFGLVPTIVKVAALTSAVIRNQVQEMTHVSIENCCCCCVEAIPVLLQPLATNHKSKTVREACVSYLTSGLQHWKDALVGEENSAILMSTGNQLIASMRDPMPAVREQARKGVDVLRQAYPRHIFESLVKKNAAASSADVKFQNLLERAMANPKVPMEQLMNSTSKMTAQKAKKATTGGPSKFARFRQMQQQQEKKKLVEEKKQDDGTNGVLVL